VTASCPSGLKPLGGGFRNALQTDGVTASEVALTDDGPSDDGTGWTVNVQRAVNATPSIGSVTVYAICA
jgi:hypothetical protein